MGMPQFDFNRTESTQGSPKLAPWQGSHGEGAAWFIYVGAGLTLGILLALFIQKRLRHRERRVRRDRSWNRLHEICVKQDLSGNEERLLTGALRQIGATNPDHAASNQNYFETLVAPELTRRIGRNGTEKIRRKLFFDGVEEKHEPELGGTHELTAGQKLRLHFAGISGTYNCTVINVARSGFIVTLPATDGHHIRPRNGDAVDGYVEMGSSLCSFESRVVETFRGGVFACRIAHANELKHSHRRKSVRVDVQRQIVFGHFPGTSVNSGQVNLNALQNQLAERWEGTLRDLSVGGCALATPVRQNFEVGDFVQFALQPMQDDPSHSFLGTIVHVSPIPAPEGGGRILHIQFLGLDEDAEGSLTRAIYRLRGETDAGGNAPLMEGVV